MSYFEGTDIPNELKHFSEKTCVYSVGVQNTNKHAFKNFLTQEARTVDQTRSWNELLRGSEKNKKEREIETYHNKHTGTVWI